MSDDLVKRLRSGLSDFDDWEAAADRIEELEANLAELLCQARQEGRKSERKAVVNYLRIKGTVVSRILGKAIEEGLHCVDK